MCYIHSNVLNVILPYYEFMSFWCKYMLYNIRAFKAGPTFKKIFMSALRNSY